MNKKNTNKLDDLPDDIKMDLHYLILEGFSSHKIKQLLEKKYEKNSAMLIVNRITYDSYMNIHHDELEQDEKLKQKLVETSKESFDQLGELQKAIETGDDISVKDQLDKLREYCAKRLEFIIGQQANGFSSPQYENVFVQYIKVLQTLLDKTIQYRDEVEVDKQQLTKDILLTLLDRIVIATEYSYKEIHGNDRFSEFIDAVKSRLQGAIDDTLKEHGYWDD